MTTPPRYPRDLSGYGPNRPDPQWPGGARLAVQIVLNYEEGGENNILHGDAASEAFLSEITGAQPWPGQRHWNMESIYEYGARAGFWRLHQMLGDLPLTVYAVASALARSPEQVLAMQEAGWEIASHGLKWVEHKDMDPEEERAQISEAIRLHAEVTGAPPRGWYTGRTSMNSVALVAEQGLAYIADSYADDLPYWLRLGARDQLIVPYTLDCNDMRFAIQAGHPDGASWERYMRDTFDTLLAEGGGMMSIGLHCRLAGRPGRAAALRRFLDHARAQDGVWFATRAQIADHWAATHPPAQSPRPSLMSRAEWIAAFGGVFEHSQWVAERSYELELGPAHDGATGVHSALCRAFRAATPAERMGVLRAHPDLAGKLAAARRLTEASASEQASAGLDALTDAERAAFERLNAAYTARHGFPFIIAVRDHDKRGILAAMERRVDQATETEFAEACGQVERIAALRLQDLLA